MATSLCKLSAKQVENLKAPGRYSDGGNLYLLITPSGAKRWLFLYRWRGRLREMGLGGVTKVSLAKAREKAAEARQSLGEGKDPLDEKRALEAIPTFGEMADQYIADHAPNWRSAKHKAQWAMTLTEYAAPIRPMRVDAITTEDVLRVLRPLWQSRPETASRLRGRIEAVLDAARARGFRSDQNPAVWKGHLSHLLGRQQKLNRGHHAAMPFAEVPGFMSMLRANDCISARALEFAILTAARTGEAIGATWSEIDLAARVWSIPAGRMKAGRPHRVPLSDDAATLLEKLGPGSPEAFLFPGGRARPLSNMAMQMLLRGMQPGFTVHGFRSTFRDWAGEATSFPREVAELALAHVVGDQTEQAYRRGDALERRREMMEAWARFCGAPTGANVVLLLRAGNGD